MVAFESREVFPRPIASVWELLQRHLDDQQVRAIHPLILRQATLRTEADTRFVERTIDVRGKHVPSVWKVTYQPPKMARWELVESQGPWTKGSWLENTYSEVPGGTQIESRGDLTIAGLPFFLSQSRWVRKVLDRIGDEDLVSVGTP